MNDTRDDPRQRAPRPRSTARQEGRRHVQDLPDARVLNPGRSVSLLHQLGPVGPEEIQCAAVGGYDRATDIADAAPLRLETDAGRPETPLLETQLLRRGIAQIAFDDEKGHACLPRSAAM